jgi:hypothetical protein
MEFGAGFGGELRAQAGKSTANLSHVREFPICNYFSYINLKAGPGASNRQSRLAQWASSSDVPSTSASHC